MSTRNHEMQISQDLGILCLCLCSDCRIAWSPLANSRAGNKLGASLALSLSLSADMGGVLIESTPGTNTNKYFHCWNVQCAWHRLEVSKKNTKNTFLTSNILQTIPCQEKPTVSKDKRHITRCPDLTFFIMCAISKPSFHLWTHPQGFPRKKDGEERSHVQGTSRHMLSPFSLTLLLPAEAPCLSLDPLFVTLATAGIPPLCIPLVYSLYHPSINDPFTEAAGRGMSSAPSTFWGM